MEGKLFLLYEEAKAKGQVLRRHILQTMEQRREESAKSYHSAVYGLGGIALGGLLISLALSLGQLRAIMRPIEEVVAYFNRMAEGILTDRIDISRRDEFGDIYGSLAVMQTSIKVMLDNIRDAVAALRQNGADLDAQMFLVTMQSQNQQRQVESVVATTEQFTQAVVEVAHSARCTADAAGDSRQLVAACNASMSQGMAANMRVVGTVNDSSRIIGA